MALRLDPPGHEPGTQAQFLAAIACPFGDTGAAGGRCNWDQTFQAAGGSGVSIGGRKVHFLYCNDLRHPNTR